jgi:hypothetical protein
VEDPAGSAAASELRNAVEGLTGEAGMQFEVAPAIQPQDVQPEWKVVVFGAAPPNLADYAAAAPQTQFVAVSTGGIEPAANVSLIETRREYIAFTAGFIAVLVADDWRSGGLLPNDTPLGAGLEDAFRNGGLYFCGTCNTYYAPFVRFPLTASMPSGTDSAGWQSAMAEMDQSFIYALYLAPEAASPELLSTLAARGLILFGSAAPPPEVQSLWAVTIAADAPAALRELWPQLLAGQGGQRISAAINLTDINPQYLTPGKQRQVEMMLDDLLAGFIDPYTPAQ